MKSNRLVSKVMVAFLLMAGFAFADDTSQDAWYDDGSGNVITENAGNVGIGTTTPAYKLDVVGTVFADEIITGDGNYTILEPGIELTSSLLSQEGMTFILPPGDYNLSTGGVWLSNSHISVIGFKGTNIIKTDNNGRLVVAGDHCLFQNFTFDRNGKAGDNIAVLNGSKNNKFDNIYMHDSSGATVAFGPGFYLNGVEDTQIMNCVIKKNITGGIVMAHNASNNVVISGNLIEENGGDGVSIHVGGENCKVIGNRIINNSGHGIQLNHAPNNIISNNIIENHATGSGIQLRSPDVSSITHHNIITDNNLRNNGEYGIDFYTQYPAEENKNMVIGNTCDNNTLGAMRIADISDNRIAFNEGADYDLSGDVMIDGNVGIGTTESSEMLEVNGNIKLSGNIISDTSSVIQTSRISSDSDLTLNSIGDIVLESNVGIGLDPSVSPNSQVHLSENKVIQLGEAADNSGYIFNYIDPFSNSHSVFSNCATMVDDNLSFVKDGAGMFFLNQDTHFISARESDQSMEYLMSIYGTEGEVYISGPEEGKDNRLNINGDVSARNLAASGDIEAQGDIKMSAGRNIITEGAICIGFCGD